MSSPKTVNLVNNLNIKFCHRDTENTEEVTLFYLKIEIVKLKMKNLG